MSGNNQSGVVIAVVVVVVDVGVDERLLHFSKRSHFRCFVSYLLIILIMLIMIVVVVNDDVVVVHVVVVVAVTNHVSSEINIFFNIRIENKI